MAPFWPARCHVNGRYATFSMESGGGQGKHPADQNLRTQVHEASMYRQCTAANMRVGFETGALLVLLRLCIRQSIAPTAQAARRSCGQPCRDQILTDC
eukprot:365479-Chlamydomonas_euryale.AAC.2